MRTVRTMNNVLTFANEHRESIESGEKTVTFRHAADPHPVGSTLVLLDEDGDLIGEATVGLRQHVPLCDIVENREYAGHETYESVDEAVAVLSDYYPDKQIGASTWIDVIGWGDLNTEPDPELRADGGQAARDLQWGHPLRANRWHIFENGESLCNNWMFGAATQDVEADDSYTEGKDCKACCRKAGLLDGVDRGEGVATDGGCDARPTGEVEQCSRSGCEEEANWRWYNGKGAFGPYCDGCAREQLESEHFQPITRQEDVSGTYVISAGIQPVGSMFPTIRSKQAFDIYLRTNGEKPRQCEESYCSNLRRQCDIHGEETELRADGGTRPGHGVAHDRLQTCPSCSGIHRPSEKCKPWPPADEEG